MIQQKDSRPIRTLHIATAPVVELADFRPFWVIVIVLSYLSLLALLWERGHFPARLALYIPIVLLVMFGGIFLFDTERRKSLSAG